VENLDYKTIIYEKDEKGIVTITFNQPERLNPQSPFVYWEIRKALKEMSRDDEVKVAIFTGKGRAFSSGADFKMDMDLPEDAEIDLEDISQKGLILELFDFEKPTIAAVNGVAMGGGWNLAQACDLVYASEKATMGYVFVKRAVVPEMGSTYILPRLVGIHKAKELMLSGDTFDAKKALELGLVNKVLPAEELMPEVRKVAEKMAKGPTLALKLTKKIINGQLRDHISHALDLENEGWHKTMGSTDFAEAVMAFLEKREPRFTGM
jgi:enoyl-CoA hydratase/carnithine racemase